MKNRFYLIFLLTFLLVGCGQYGPLYLPKKSKTQKIETPKQVKGDHEATNP